MTEVKRLGFVGLGVMGEPMCRNLAVGSGGEVLAFDISVDPLQRLAKHGVAAVSDVSQLARQCDMIFLALPSGEQVQCVCAGNKGLLNDVKSGQIIIDLGTSPVGLARELSEAFLKKGANFVDAPIARTREAAQKGTLSIMVGGRKNDFDMILPFLRYLGSDITYCGPSGAGQAMKILNNMVLMETVAAMSEAAALAKHLNLSVDFLFETLSKGSADSFALRNHGMKAIAPGNFPDRAFSSEYALKDLKYALAISDDAGLELLGAKAAERYLNRSISGGDGGRYWPIISKYVRKTSN